MGEALDEEIMDELSVKFGIVDDALEDLFKQIQDAGISIVDKDGNPSPLALVTDEIEKEEVSDTAMDEIVTNVRIDDPVRMYLKEIGRYPLISLDEETKLAEAIIAGGEGQNLRNKCLPKPTCVWLFQLQNVILDVECNFGLDSRRKYGLDEGCG